MAKRKSPTQVIEQSALIELILEFADLTLDFNDSPSQYMEEYREAWLRVVVAVTNIYSAHYVTSFGLGDLAGSVMHVMGKADLNDAP